MKFNRKVNTIKGNGFCFLNAVRTSLFLDYGIHMSFDQLIETITQHLIDNYCDYEDSHVGGADKLVIDATNFFSDGNFNRDVVDIIVEATGHAIGFKLAIIKKSPAGNIQRYITGCQTADKTLFLKFANQHYDSITKISPHEEFILVSEEDLEDEQEETQNPQTQSTQLFDEEDFLHNLPRPVGQHFVTDIEDSSVERYLRPRIRFPHFIYENCTPKEIPYIPSNINYTCAYRVKCTPMDYIKKTSDRRWFNMRTTSNINLGGIQKIGICQGSWTCPNETCSYLNNNNKPNQYHWEFKSGARVCYQCGQFATREICGAKKYIELPPGDTHATVYHLGVHKCQLQPDAASDAKFTRKWMEKFPGLSFNAFKNAVVRHLLDSNSIEEAQEAAGKITRQAFRKNNKEQPIATVGFETQSLEAVAELKKGSDKQDVNYIYEVNSSAMNNKPDYVMKSSTIMLKEALKMDQNEDRNELQQEDAYFDGCHSRCTGYISLGLWVMYPVLRKIVRLASMECKSERSDTIETFWRLFNQMLINVGKKDISYTWSPRYIFNDEAGSNFVGASRVFGQEFAANRIVTCQWHFMNKLNERINHIGESHRQEFIDLGKQITLVKTIPQFEITYKRMEEISAMYPACGMFLKWYYARRSHLFPAFREGIHSGLNLAEVGNAKWKPKTKLSLVSGLYKGN